MSLPPQSKVQRGAAAEAMAAAYASAHGLCIVARNVRYRCGELDLVGLDGEVLAIVEVRQRGRADYGGALSSVTWRKQRRLVRTAQRYLQSHPEWRRHRVRFDVVALEGDPAGVIDITWVKAAFVAA